MRKLITIALMLVGTLTYAHSTTVEEDRKVYEFINTQLQEGVINAKTAQMMWKAYQECCDK